MNQRYEKSRQYVGTDLHRRRSVIVRLDGEREVLEDGIGIWATPGCEAG